MRETPLSPEKQNMLDFGWVFTIVFALLINHFYPNINPELSIGIALTPIMIFIILVLPDAERVNKR